ncbi:carbohydrate porin [Lichenicola cladoniae]|uniref:Carbohydrate porin n=1 Tax=Lichenicola cladoniae TaxID=1484109 RepID=A0A6M8HGL0_9PROT|nr:carbohydrate porin [Acetobacteraceae bacterium]QKE88792.1 carbohydrate porin [Lichenicola cladoniae]
MAGCSSTGRSDGLAFQEWICHRAALPIRWLRQLCVSGLDLPGSYKIGGWYNSNAFTDQFYTGSAFSSVQAFGSFARSRKNDWSVYAVIDQMVYRPGKMSAGGVSVFFRAMGAPGNRNLVNVFVDAGVVCKGLFDRDNDTVGLGVNWARISDTARAEDSVVDRSSYLPRPVRSSETDLDLSYQAQLAPWWILQPYVQYVFKPGAGIVSSTNPAKVIGDALVLGLRSTLSF